LRDSVAIIKTLDALLNNESIGKEILEEHPDDEKMHDFCDGSVFETHSLFSVDKKELQIVAYYDELEITNPL
uniref:Uncharacterized protein n=1 Tax=Amphimedon queenslandica TaxID=400682 RepID=A0A1X7SZ48_AMPQE